MSRVYCDFSEYRVIKQKQGEQFMNNAQEIRTLILNLLKKKG